MNDYLFRTWRSEDIPHLVSLWADTFGDSEKLIMAFLSLLPDIGTCYVASTYNGDIVSAAYLITGMRLVSHKDTIPCAYIYAVATVREHRGRGLAAELCAICKEKALESGKLVFTKPAEDGLFDYYSRTIGTDRVFICDEVFLESTEYICGAYKKIDAEVYNKAREGLLIDTPHLAVSLPCMSFEQRLCEENGGGLLYAEDCYAAVYIDEGHLRIIELLDSELSFKFNRERYYSLCLRLASSFGCKGVIVNLPSEDKASDTIAFNQKVKEFSDEKKILRINKRKHITSLPCSLCDNMLWNILFD